MSAAVDPAPPADAPPQETGNEGLADLFVRNDNAIGRHRTENLFKQLDERELTQQEQDIIQKRIESQRLLFAEYEKREAKRKLKEVMELVPDLPEAAAQRALELCNGKEDEAAMRCMESWAFRRRVLTDVGLYTPPEPAAPRSRSGKPLLAAATAEGVRVLSPSKVGTVFVGRFRGKTGPLPGRGQPTPAPPQQVPGSDPSSPGVQQLLRGRRTQQHISRGAGGQEQGSRSQSRSVSPSAAAAEEMEEEPPAAAAATAAQASAAATAAVTAAVDASAAAAKATAAAGGRQLRPRRARPAALLQAPEEFRTLLGSDSDEEEPMDDELTQSEGFSMDEDEDSGSASESEEGEEVDEEAGRAAAAAAASRAAVAMYEQQQEEEVVAHELVVKAVARQVAKLAPYEAVAKLTDLESRRPGSSVACLALLASTYPPAVAEPIATAWEVQKALEAADAAEEAEVLRQSLQQRKKRKHHHQQQQSGAGSSKREDVQAAVDQGEGGGQQRQNGVSGGEGAAAASPGRKQQQQAAGEGGPSASDASTMSATVTAPEMAALAAGGEEAGGTTPSSKQRQQQQGRPPVAPGGGSGAKRLLAPLAPNKSSTRAISDSGHTCRGRVRQKSHKATEMLELGVLVNHPAWYNAGYIFPLGFKSRVLFRSSVDLNSVCVHVCEVVGEGGDCWPAPTFKVTAADRPEEPVTGRSCTGCWSQILKRINSVITQRIAAGEPLPPPPRTAIAGPEYFGFNDPAVIESVESLDPDHTCTTYWAGKAEREAALATGRGGRGGKGGRAQQAAAAAGGSSGGGGGGNGGGGGSSGGGAAAGGSGGAGGRKRGRGRPSAEQEAAEAEEDGETGYTGTRWSSIERRERYRKRCQEAGEEPTEDENLLPGVIDPVTLEPVVCPAIAPSGHVMGLATWHAVLAEAPRCPFTKQPLRREQLVVLTQHNIDKYRDRIITN